MSQFFFVLTLIALAGTVGTLLFGLAAMSVGGDFNKRYGNRLMRWRVILQGVTILCFVLAMLSAQNGG